MTAPKSLILDLVKADLDARDAKGRATYGSSLRIDSANDALTFLYEELLDAAMYARQEIERRKAASSAPAAAIHVIARSEPQPPGITNGAVENGPEEAIQVIAPATTGPGPVCGAWHAKSESACILAPHAHGVHVGDYSGEGDLFMFTDAAVKP